MTTYFVLSCPTSLGTLPAILQCLPHRGDQVSTKGDLPSDHQSFLGNTVTPVLVCLRCDKKHQHSMPIKFSSARQFWFKFCLLKEKMRSSPVFLQTTSSCVGPKLFTASNRILSDGGEFPPTCSIAYVCRRMCAVDRFLPPISRSPREYWG